MLYGDDDTLWFTGGVLTLLKDLDPQMPYVITGMACCAVLSCCAELPAVQRCAVLVLMHVVLHVLCCAALGLSQIKIGCHHSLIKHLYGTLLCA